MKKALCAWLVASLLSSVSAFAEQTENNKLSYQPDHYFDLKVEIRNFGADNCQLTKKLLLEGSLHSSDFPSIIVATGERYWFTLRGDNTEALLTYQCGEHKKFTLYMHQYLKPNYHHVTIDASMQNAIDVFETHQISLADHSYGEHMGKLKWQIMQ